jgi:signal transduction histidine kinase/ActR/RegA family two-component response regulator
MKLRSHLILVILVTLLPLIAFSAAMMVLFHRNTTTATEKGLQDTTRALALAVDRELGASIAALETLAVSPNLEAGELSAFYRTASLALSRQARWQNVVLYTPSGQQLLNLRVPFGAPEPWTNDPESIRRVASTRSPVVSNLFMDRVPGRHLVQVAVPVTRHGRLQYVLSAAFGPDLLNTLLKEQRLPQEITLSLLDRNKILIGRTRFPERFVGQPATGDLAAESTAKPAGSFVATTKEETRVYAAFSRSALAGWTVALSAPTAAIDRPQRSSLWLIALGGGACLLLGVGAATLMATHVSRSILSLSTSAENLARRDDIHWTPSNVAEVNVAGAAIQQAGSALQQAHRKNAELLQQMERQRRSAEALADVGRLVARSLDPREVSQVIVESVQALLDARMVVVYRVDRDRKHLQYLAGIGEGIVWDQTVAADAAAVGLAMRELKPITTSDVLSDPRIRLSAEERAQLEPSGTRAILAVPLVVGAMPVGVLAVGDRLGRAFAAEDVALVEQFCNQVAAALENTRLYQELRTAYEELSRAQEQLTQSQKMEAVGRLAGGVAHDFNNLLTVILGRCDLLLARLHPQDPAQEPIALIKATAERAAQVTRQLLAFSRKQVLQPRVLDVNDIVEAAATLLQRLVGEDVAFTFRPGPDLGSVQADPGQLEQVIINLVVNARDAMPNGGRITIETANVALARGFDGRDPDVTPGSYVMLAVSDTGTGIAPEILPRIFEPFFTTKGPGQGTGLGLSTVYGIIKQSGGTIGVHSEHGIGTAFKVYLPRIERSRRSNDARAVEAICPKGSETILLVEDDDDLRDLAREILTGNGYEVLACSGPAEALAMVDRCSAPVHLLLTDVVMPDMSGRELAERLAPTQARMRVVYMSGYTDDAVVRHGVLTTGLAFIQKPFTPHALLGTVRETLVGADVAPSRVVSTVASAHAVA